MADTINFNHILVPYDFSETAKKALHHAGVLAKKSKSTISVLHVKSSFSHEIVHSEVDYKDVSFEKYQVKVGSILEQDIAGYASMYEVPIKSKIVEGKINSKVEAYISEHKIDLMVLGTFGMKGRDKFFMGSNAYKLVNNTKIPVLAIQKNAPTYHYQRIMLPMDGSFHTREKIPYAIKFGIQYNAEVYLTGFLTGHSNELKTQMNAIMNQTRNFLTKYEVQNNSEIVDVKNLAQGTLAQAAKHECSLIIIMTEQEKAFSGLFLGPAAQQIVQHSEVPVLLIPPKVSMTTNQVTI